jgi:hypothetical protein
MSRFMRRNPRRRYTGRKVHLLAKPQRLGSRIVVIAQDSWRRLDPYVLKPLRVQQTAGYLRSRNSVLGAHLRILGNIDFDARLRVEPKQQARQDKYPK